MQEKNFPGVYKKLYPRNTLLAHIRGYIFYSIIILLIIFLAAPLLLYAGIFQHKTFIFSRVPGVFYGLYKLFGIELVIHGREHIQPGKSYLVLSNHQSFLDIPVVMQAFGIVSFLAKAEIEKWFLFGYGMRMMDCLFVDRNNQESRRAVSEKLSANIAKGISYCVFPEGTRSRNGKMKNFKKGIFGIALNSGVDILPVSINGAFQVLPANGIRLNPGKIICTIHPPIHSLNYTDSLYLATDVHKIIASGIL